MGSSEQSSYLQIVLDKKFDLHPNKTLAVDRVGTVIIGVKSGFVSQFFLFYAFLEISAEQRPIHFFKVKSTINLLGLILDFSMPSIHYKFPPRNYCDVHFRRELLYVYRPRRLS